MPRQNRVTPDGTLIAVPDRGLFWGNRGPLLDRDGRLVRYSRGRAWAICVLSFKGRRRQLWAPGRLTELFFLDEATGLAAGHRPCGECRYRDYLAFKRAWAVAFRGGVPAVAQIDGGVDFRQLPAPSHTAPLEPDAKWNQQQTQDKNSWKNQEDQKADIGMRRPRHEDVIEPEGNRGECGARRDYRTRKRDGILPQEIDGLRPTSDAFSQIHFGPPLSL